jgi:CDP-glucose 4,6-dehydratase
MLALFALFMQSRLKGQNVLVTGGTGLVGGYVTEKLLTLEANVFVLDIILRPKSYFETQNLKNKTTLLMQDVRDLLKLKEIVLKNEITYIFHLAAQALVPVAFTEPHLTLDTNIMGTVNVLEVARKNPKIKAVVVASSDKAYGKDCINAIEDQKLAGDHPYDVSKSAADLICTAYFNTYGTPVTISRFANIFGPGDLNFNRIVPGVMKAIINKEVLEIRSNGEFVRDYIYVKDVAEGYVLLAEKIGAIKGQAFNFSAGQNFSVLDLIKKIEAVLGTKFSYKILNEEKNEIPFQTLNFEKAKKVLSWQAKYTFEQGIKETFEWYKDFFN